MCVADLGLSPYCSDGGLSSSRRPGRRRRRFRLSVYRLPSPHVPGELLVQFATNVSSSQVNNLGTEQGYSVLDATLPLSVYKIKVQGDLNETWQSLVDSPGVLSVQPNYYHTWNFPDDPHYDDGQLIRSEADSNDFQRWYLGPNLLNAEAAWDITTGRPDVIIAVIDTGVDLDHPDLAANIWVNPGEVPQNGLDDDGNGFVDDVNGWDFCGTSFFQDFGPFIGVVCTGQDNDPNPDLGDGVDNNQNGLADENTGRGTGVAGVAAAVGNNGFGVAGAAWSVTIMPLKIFAEEGSADTASVINAINYAAANGADIINLSLGFSANEACPVISPLEEAAIAAAISGGAVVVAAGGNNNSSDPSTPASCTGVISVGASDHDSTFNVNVTGNPKDPDGRASFSSFGPSIDVVAPGVALTTTNVASKADELQSGFTVGNSLILLDANGTSFSAPLVTGLAALVMSAAKDQGGKLTPAEVQSIIIGTATDLPDDPDDSPDAGVDWDGAGMVNFQAAVQKAQALTAPPPTVLVPGYSTWSLITVAALMTMFTMVVLRRRLRRT